MGGTPEPQGYATPVRDIDQDDPIRALGRFLTYVTLDPQVADAMAGAAVASAPTTYRGLVSAAWMRATDEPAVAWPLARQTLLAAAAGGKTRQVLHGLGRLDRPIWHLARIDHLDIAVVIGRLRCFVKDHLDRADVVKANVARPVA